MSAALTALATATAAAAAALAAAAAGAALAVAAAAAGGAAIGGPGRPAPLPAGAPDCWASSSRRRVSEIRLRGMSMSRTFTRTMSPGFTTSRGSFTNV